MERGIEKNISTARKEIEKVVNNYFVLFPEERSSKSLLFEQLEQPQNIFDRKNLRGHITASGLLISPDNKVLVIFHSKLQRFLQPGGHFEETDEDIFTSAKREIEEEVNLHNIRLYNWCFTNQSPIMIDTHEIPENKKDKEDKHFHHDFMFIFTTDEEEITLDKNEATDFKWIGVDDLLQEDTAISAALNKMRSLKII